MFHTFADSKHVELIQVADLFAFIIRLYAELKESFTEEKFEGELARLRGWIDLMNPVLMRDSTRWNPSSKDPCTTFLRAVAPLSLLSL